MYKMILNDQAFNAVSSFLSDDRVLQSLLVKFRNEYPNFTGLKRDFPNFDKIQEENIETEDGHEIFSVKLGDYIFYFFEQKEKERIVVIDVVKPQYQKIMGKKIYAYQ